MTDTANVSQERPIRPSVGWLVLMILIALVCGYVVLIFVQFLVHLIWETIPNDYFSGHVPAWYLLGLPVLAGLLVALARRRGNGHSPIEGLALGPVSVTEYPGIILAILASLFGGIVLGPEVALVSTGAVIGGVVAAKQGTQLQQASVIGALASICALLVNPLLSGSLNIGIDYTFAWNDLYLAAAAAVCATIALALIQWLAWRLQFLRGGDRPVIWQLMLAGLAVGGTALWYQAIVDEPVILVLTSGEEQIRSLLMIGSSSVIALTVALKGLAYMISLGSGFRGGPFFPAMFVGAGMGGIISIWAGVNNHAAAVGGILAAMLYLAKPKWIATIIIAIVVGWVLGGVPMLVAAFVGSVIGKFMPKPDPVRVEEAEPDQVPVNTQTA